jgi:hypothetical protein
MEISDLFKLWMELYVKCGLNYTVLCNEDSLISKVLSNHGHIHVFLNPKHSEAVNESLSSEQLLALHYYISVERFSYLDSSFAVAKNVLNYHYNLIGSYFFTLSCLWGFCSSFCWSSIFLWNFHIYILCNFLPHLACYNVMRFNYSIIYSVKLNLMVTINSSPLTQ